MTRKKKGFDITKAVDMSSAEIGSYLDDREKKFAREYLVDMNATQAAIRAGYRAGKNNSSAAVQGCRLMRNDIVIAYRRALIKENLADKDITRENIALKFSEIFDRCMQKTPVMEFDRDSKEWEETGKWEFDAKGAAKALEGLTKLFGYDAPTRTEITGISIENELQALENDEEGGKLF